MGRREEKGGGREGCCFLPPVQCTTDEMRACVSPPPLSLSSSPHPILQFLSLQRPAKFDEQLGLEASEEGRRKE